MPINIEIKTQSWHLLSIYGADNIHQNITKSSPIIKVKAQSWHQLLSTQFPGQTTYIEYSHKANIATVQCSALLAP